MKIDASGAPTFPPSIEQSGSETRGRAIVSFLIPLPPLTVKNLLTTATLGALTASGASASEIFVSGNILTSQTWTADNTYNLQGQVYVLPGATLTIEPGTQIISDPGGSLAVSKGAQIFANGQSGAPIIFTSKADAATWTNGDPTTGTWRASALEWGNLTLMGDAYISENATPGNTAFPSAGNFAEMEGLTPPAGSTIAQYGGGNDDDDSGSLTYCSFRYGGQVVALDDELNGLSLGGIGRGTDIHHIEIMNNVDDGIEIWGGTVNLKYFSIWNVGDDSLDIDQGYRGKVQFGLIVQGYSLNADQGSGVGDNAIETDGGEDSFWQPLTTTTMYNLTVIGNPISGDGLTAWRDGARVQYRNSIFMDGGETLVRPDGDDGDGASGYGNPGANPPVPGLTFAQVWTTPFSTFPAPNAPANPAAFYQAQTSGNLAEMTNNVFYRNLNGNAYTEANARGVLAPANNNVLLGFSDPSPIASITRGSLFSSNFGEQVLPVVGLDPTPTNAAASANGIVAPNDGFFSRADYRGAFSPDTENNWLSGWTASEAFGFTSGDAIGTQVCESLPNSTGVISQITAFGSPVASDNDFTVQVYDLPRNQFGIFFTSIAPTSGTPFGNGRLCVSPQGIGRINIVRNSGATGVVDLTVDLTSVPQGNGNITVMSGDTRYFQLWHRDTTGAGFNASNALEVTFE